MKKDIPNKDIVFGDNFNVIFHINLEVIGENLFLKEKTIVKSILIKIITIIIIIIIIIIILIIIIYATSGEFEIPTQNPLLFGNITHQRLFKVDLTASLFLIFYKSQPIKRMF